MNCFELRRRTLANPRESTREHKRHARACSGCGALADELERFEGVLHDAALVPVPDALAARVLLRHGIRRPVPTFSLGLWALAASLVLAVGAAIHFNLESAGSERSVPLATRGEQRVAAAAISYVLDYEPQLLQENRAGDPTEMRHALMQLGLRLPDDGVTVRYLGKCPVIPDGTAEHIVLKTSLGQATLILAPSRSFASRESVTYRDRTAIVSPARAGGYILVSDSQKTIRSIEKMLM